MKSRRKTLPCKGWALVTKHYRYMGRVSYRAMYGMTIFDTNDGGCAGSRLAGCTLRFVGR